MAGLPIRLSARCLRIARSWEPEQRAELSRLLRIIALDPAPDGRHKILLPLLPIVYTVYHGSGIWIVYRVRDNIIEVQNVGRPPAPPTAPWQTI